MRYLCVSQHSPGQMDAFAAALAEQPQNEVILASARQGPEKPHPAIRRMILKKPRYRREDGYSPWLGAWRQALATAKDAESAWQSLAATAPDIVLAQGSSGVAFSLPEFFGNALLASYADCGLGDYAASPELMAAKKDIQTCRFLKSGLCFIRHESQLADFPELLAPLLKPLPLFVDAEFFRPPAGRQGEAAAFIAGPAEGLPGLFRLALGLALNRPGADIVIFACGRWKLEILSGWLSGLEKGLAGRIRLVNWIGPADARRIFQEALLTVCLQPVLSSAELLLAAQACGSLTLAPPGWGPTLPAGGGEDGLRHLLEILREAPRLAPRAAAGRAWVLRHHDQAKILPPHLEMLLETRLAMEGKKK